MQEGLKNIPDKSLLEQGLTESYMSEHKFSVDGLETQGWGKGMLISLDLKICENTQYLPRHWSQPLHLGK